jgi:plasmid stability protein
MKTTINLKDDVVRRLKSRAALRGQSLSKFMEESLEQKLLQDESSGDSVAEWIETLPVIPRAVANEVDKTMAHASFNKIDPELFG